MNLVSCVLWSHIVAICLCGEKQRNTRTSFRNVFLHSSGGHSKFRIWGLFTPPWPPQNHSLCYPQVLLYSCDPQFFTKFLHCCGLIIFKSGYATETFVKELGGVGGFLHSKGICVFSTALRHKSMGWDTWNRVHQKLHHLFVTTRSILWALEFPTIVWGE